MTTVLTGGSALHGVNWFFGYALTRPNDLTCGFITNPDEANIAMLHPCGRAASYEFQFKGDGFTWQAACAEHASVVRERDRITRVRSLRGLAAVEDTADGD